MTFQYSNVFLCEIFSFILVLGLILVQTAVLAKDINCVFLHRKSYTSQPELNQTIIAYQTFNRQGMKKVTECLDKIILTLALKTEKR